MLGVLLSWPTADLTGQEIRPVSMEMAVGLVGGSTGAAYRYKIGVSYDLLAGGLLKKGATANVFAGATLGTQYGPPSDAKCVPSPRGGCKELFPDFTTLTLVAGFESADAALRMVTGPLYAKGDESALGWEARGTAFTRLFDPVSVGILVRGAIVPSYGPDTFVLATGALVVRMR